VSYNAKQYMKIAVKRDFKFWVNVATFAALIFLVVISWGAIVDAFKNLATLDTGALLLMIPLQLLNYYAVARLYKDYFKSVGEDLKTRNAYSIALELNFVNHVFPSGGVSGFSYLSLRLKQNGISTAKSTLAQILRFALTFLSFLILIFVGMLILALRRQTSPLTILIASSIAFLTLIGVGVGMYIISSEKRIRAFVSWLPRVLNRVVGVFRKSKKDVINMAKLEQMLSDLHKDYVVLSHDPKSLKMPFFWAMMVNVTDLMTIYAVYIAFGQWINPGALIIAYAVANFAGLVAILPGGVGIYEGLMTATLASAGVNKALALSATVTYRIINMILFLPPGYFLYQRVIKNASWNQAVESAKEQVEHEKAGEHHVQKSPHKETPHGAHESHHAHSD
jgi:uncharacterized protein (TIRG00374 family)